MFHSPSPQKLDRNDNNSRRWASPDRQRRSSRSNGAPERGRRSDYTRCTPYPREKGDTWKEKRRSAEEMRRSSNERRRASPEVTDHGSPIRLKKLLDQMNSQKEHIELLEKRIISLESSNAAVTKELAELQENCKKTTIEEEESPNMARILGKCRETIRRSIKKIEKKNGRNVEEGEEPLKGYREQLEDIRMVSQLTYLNTVQLLESSMEKGGGVSGEKDGASGEKGGANGEKAGTTERKGIEIVEEEKEEETAPYVSTLKQRIHEIMGSN